MLISWYVN